jgi:hypothetical protein
MFDILSAFVLTRIAAASLILYVFKVESKFPSVIIMNFSFNIQIGRQISDLILANEVITTFIRVIKNRNISLHANAFVQ